MSAQRRVRIPADTDRPDALIAGLSPRQVVIASVAVLIAAAIYESTRAWLPIEVIAVALVPVAAFAAILVFGQADGVSADRLAVAALRHASSPAAYLRHNSGEKRPSTRDAANHRSRCAAKRLLPPSPLTRVKGEIGTLCLPVRSVSPEGIVDLGADGSALVACASTINFSLLSAPEQEAAVSSFANFLNGLEGPVSFHLAFAPVDLTSWLADFDEAQASRAYRSQLLVAAAAKHRSFVASQAASTKTAGRRLIVVFTSSVAADHATDILVRRLEEAAEAVSHLGIALTRLDASQAMLAIGTSCPGSPDGTIRSHGDLDASWVRRAPTSADLDASWVARGPISGEPSRPGEAFE